MDDYWRSTAMARGLRITDCAARGAGWRVWHAIVASGRPSDREMF